MDKKRERSEKAVALRYDRDRDGAPQVVAKGKGWIASKIIEEAKAHGLPFREDPLLVEALIGLDLYQEVPEELYRVIAEVYAFLYEVRNDAFGVQPSHEEELSSG